jgi:O-antigen ligase
VTALDVRGPELEVPARGASASRWPEVLVIGGAAIAPLNLLFVRSFTVYDAMVCLAAVSLAHRQQITWPRSRYLAMSYLFVVATLVSAFRATHATEALTQTAQYVFVFFVEIPVVMSVVTTRRRAIASVALLCAGTLAAILHAYLTQPTQGAGRVLVFYSENPNRLGYPAVYLLPLMLALWACTRRSHLAVRTVVGIVLAGGLYLTIWAVSASGSRSSLVGSVVALLVFVVLRPGLGAVRAVGRLVVLSLVTVTLAALLAATGQLPTTLEERINRSLDRSDPSARTHLVRDRENLADAGMAAFDESPLIGVGLDNFRYVTPRYGVEASAQLPHNLWLQLLVQVGLIGTLAFGLYLLAWFVECVLAMHRAHPLDASLLWGLVAALTGILTVFMFAPEMLDRHYWLVVALGLAILHGTRHDRASKGPRHK